MQHELAKWKADRWDSKLKDVRDGRRDGRHRSQQNEGVWGVRGRDVGHETSRSRDVKRARCWASELRDVRRALNGRCYREREKERGSCGGGRIATCRVRD